MSEDRDLGRESLQSSANNVVISPNAQFFGVARITLGHDVRIDDFSIMSSGRDGYVSLGNWIHIGRSVALFGGGGIEIGDFCTISGNSSLYSVSDDFSGTHLISPMAPAEETAVDSRPIVIANFGSVAAHSLVMPGVTFGEGAVLGAMSMATADLEPWTIYAGVPARPLRARDRRMVERASTLIADFEDRRSNER